MKKTYQDRGRLRELREPDGGGRAARPSGVAAATVNFMTQKMIVEFAEGAGREDRP